MTFSQALDVRPGITAIIGGGGKTTLMLTLARELKGKGSVIICTTTRIFPPEGTVTLIDPDRQSIADGLERHGVICVGRMYGEKIGPSDIPAEELALLADYVIAEADGAKGLPLKAHASHEPVIPDGAKVIYVIGADGIGKPIADACHRPQLYAERLGVDVNHIVTPEDAARMVDYGETVLFNKADSQRDVENGRKFAAAFSGKTVTASLKGESIAEIIQPK